MSLYCQKYSSLSHKWSLGPFIILTCCVDINNHPHTAGDVILFTFRYWAVRYPHYIHSRNSTSIWMLISFVWVMSIIVSLAPLLGWKDENWSENVKDGKCMVKIVYSKWEETLQCVCELSFPPETLSQTGTKWAQLEGCCGVCSVFKAKFLDDLNLTHNITILKATMNVIVAWQISKNQR